MPATDQQLATIDVLEQPVKQYRTHLMLCSGSGCEAMKSSKIKAVLDKEIERQGLSDEVQVVVTGCNGFCVEGPLMTVLPEGILYRKLTEDKVPQLVEEHLLKGRPVQDFMFHSPVDDELVPNLMDIDFFSKQTTVVLRNRGMIDAERIDDYIARNGYKALAKALTEMTPEEVVQEILDSGLRGRGGGGFSTGKKWASAASHAADTKYIICNADEGDPGAFMDRSILEGDPHSVVEGMCIAAHAVKANKGYVYVREEYALAVQRITTAIEQAYEYGLLGEDILGSGFNFDITIFRGAGAFVCGESSALRASIQGDPPEPSSKQTHATKEGLWGKPTVLNNVETFANVPVILLNGSAWFRTMGTEGSPGTKVFALTGCVKNTGLVEVPMGTTFREIIFDIGGGIEHDRQFKAVQTGGPSGGCLPAELLDLPVDFDSLYEAGAMMGSGGMIVMDETACMVDVAKYFIHFSNLESCGKCSTCRDGSSAMLEIFKKLTTGEATEGDIVLLEDLCEAISDTAQCGLGKTLANPVISTLRYFRDEYMEHVLDRRCRAGVCKALITYVVDPEKCKKCGKCQTECPSDAIMWQKKEVASIDPEKCGKCGLCVSACKFDAIVMA